MNQPDFKPHFNLKIGDDAPDFKAVIQDGSEIHLKSIESKWIVLFFYPEDNTPTCTKEACNLRDNYDDLKLAGAKLFGISPDSESKHQKFIAKFDLPYDLIVDKNHEIANAYDVWGTKKFMGIVYDGIHRTTYILNHQHKISKIIYPVESANHHLQILETIIT
ncbi:MAG TPA: thioredoxin-dependent thiol peroxidase [Saprospiraceae bacterium]|nr:thioredoxin-dependent thiol peroxidase [Saprospiraceae bacterium]